MPKPGGLAWLPASLVQDLAAAVEEVVTHSAGVTASGTCTLSDAGSAAKP